MSKISRRMFNQATLGSLLTYSLLEVMVQDEVLGADVAPREKVEPEVRIADVGGRRVGIDRDIEGLAPDQPDLLRRAASLREDGRGVPAVEHGARVGVDPTVASGGVHERFSVMRNIP